MAMCHIIDVDDEPYIIPAKKCDISPEGSCFLARCHNFCCYDEDDAHKNYENDGLCACMQAY